MSYESQIDVLTAKDLPITLYLNQRQAFGVLAALQGGFSQFATVQTTSSEGKSMETSGGAEVGVSHAFALLGVSLGFRKAQKTNQEDEKNTMEERVHTPTSLFAQLRHALHDQELVCNLQDTSHIDQVKLGEFVEFEATLRRSPPVEFLETIEKIMPLITLFQSFSKESNGNIQGQNRSKASNKQNVKNVKRRAKDQDPKEEILAAVAMFRKALTDGGKAQDLVAEATGMRAVLPIEENFFATSMNDIIDGTFQILGKVVQIIPATGDGYINLLRKSAFGQFSKLEALIQQLEDSMDAPNSPRHLLGYTGSLSPRVKGPALLVIPIAIFA